MSESKSPHSNALCCHAPRLAELEAHIEALQTDSAHKEVALDTLSSELALASKRISELEQLLKILVTKLQQGAEAEPFDPNQDRPPHY